MNRRRESKSIVKQAWLAIGLVGAAMLIGGAAEVRSAEPADTKAQGKSGASGGSEGQRAGFDIFLMGVVTKTNYDATPPTVTMKVIEGAMERLGQEVELIIETEEAIKHFKRRVKVGIELDTRVRVGTDGKLYMATSQRRVLPSREFKGGPSIDESLKRELAK